MLQKSLSVFILSIIVTFFISCQFNTVYDEIVPIEVNKWDKNEAAHFEVNIEDTVAAYNFYVFLHNTTDYRYSNLFVFMSTKFPNNNLTRDTIEFVLADASGKWLGKGWGNVKETDILLKTNLRFPLSGPYNFYFQQAMRNDTLEGIKSIGLRIEKLTD